MVMSIGCVNALFTSRNCKKKCKLSALILFKTPKLSFKIHLQIGRWCYKRTVREISYYINVTFSLTHSHITDPDNQNFHKEQTHF